MVLSVHPRDGLPIHRPLPAPEGCSFSVSPQQCPETGLGSALPSTLPQAEILQKKSQNRVLTLCSGGARQPGQQRWGRCAEREAVCARS